MGAGVSRGSGAGVRGLRQRRPLAAGSTLVVLSLLAGLSMGAAPASAVFPGLNGRIACDGARGAAAPTTPPPANFSTSEVYTMNPDGSDLKLLTNNEGVRDLSPSFSPDGARIAFDRRPVGMGSSSDVHTMNADGGAVNRLTFAPANDERVAWSPDGNNLAFMGGRDGNFNIFRVAANGSDTLGTQLTTHPSGDFSPAWSPDGTTIAFDTGRDTDENSEVYTMNAAQGDGNQAQVRKLTNTPPPVRNWSATWSPDGTKIVFQSTRDGTNGTPTQQDDNFEIYTMNADGSQVTRLTNTATNDPATPVNDAHDEDPAFSPDGSKIVFESNRSGDTEVHTMNADGSGVTRLTNSPGFDGRCDWQALRPAATVYPPIYTTPPVTPGKHRTSLTLRAKPRRDRRPPFRFTFSGRVRIPGGVSAAAVCGGRVRLVLKRGRRTVARRTARVSKRCTYRKRIRFRASKRTGRRRARLRVTARFGGNASLSAASRRSTTVRIF